MEEDSDVRVTENAERRRYEIFSGDDRAGFVTYKRFPDRIAFLHTEIDDRFEGRGLGSRLAAEVLDEARAHGLGVVPRCPFIRRYIERHPDYADLVVASES